MQNRAFSVPSQTEMTINITQFLSIIPLLIWAILYFLEHINSANNTLIQTFTYIRSCRWVKRLPQNIRHMQHKHKSVNSNTSTGDSVQHLQCKTDLCQQLILLLLVTVSELTSLPMT